MNEGKFIAMQNYLEEIAGQNKQIIGLLQRTNELLQRAPATLTAEIIDLDAPPYTGTLETEPPPDASKAKAPPRPEPNLIMMGEDKPRASAKKGK